MCETQKKDVTGEKDLRHIWKSPTKLSFSGATASVQDTTDQLILAFVADKCAFKVSNRNKVCSKLTIKTHEWCLSSVFRKRH